MSQSDLHTSFIKNIYRQIYFEMAFNNSAITVNDKIVIIVEEFKDIDRIIVNVFDTANAMTIVFLARNKTDLEDVKNLLNSIFDKIVFCYCSVNIINSNAIAKIFQSLRDNLEEPNVLILCAAHFHLLKTALELFEKELNQSFEVNFKANVNFVRQFFDSKKEYDHVKIDINMSIVTAHTQQFIMSIYDASKATLVHWLEHVHVENSDRLRVYHMHSVTVDIDLLRDRGVDVENWKWENDKSRMLHCDQRIWKAKIFKQSSFLMLWQPDLLSRKPLSWQVDLFELVETWMSSKLEQMKFGTDAIFWN